MNKEQLIEELRKQANALESTDGFEVIEFAAWREPTKLGSGLIRYQDKTHSSGYCRSETCLHNSHDPYMEGGTAYVKCKQVGIDETGNMQYVTPDGIVFTFNTFETGQHFAPPLNFKIKAA